MYIGIGNTYALMPLVKLVITELDVKWVGPENTGHLSVNPVLGSSFSVLFNPQSYKITRMVQGEKGQQGDKDYVPFKAVEMLEIDLFIDTFQAGAEVFGLDMMKPFTTPLKFQGNSLLPSPLKMLDANQYADQIYDLSRPDPSKHEPPIVRFTWSSLNFNGRIKSCMKEYVKFNESGMPVRIKLHCVVLGLTDKEVDLISSNIFASPDTSKFKQVAQGESLWAMANGAYSDAGAWRNIAAANGIVNPRLLNTGDTLVMPALP